jgi:hypothetical protein
VLAFRLITQKLHHVGNNEGSYKLVFFFFEVLGFELRAYTLSHSTSPFLWFFFWYWVSRLFAQAGLEPWSSWSLPPEEIGFHYVAWAGWFSKLKILSLIVPSAGITGVPHHAWLKLSLSLSRIYPYRHLHFFLWLWATIRVPRHFSAGLPWTHILAGRPVGSKLPHLLFICEGLNFSLTFEGWYGWI